MSIGTILSRFISNEFVDLVYFGYAQSSRTTEGMCAFETCV